MSLSPEVREAVEDTLTRYALACDRKNWGAFDQVFTDAVCVNYGGEFQLEGRASVVNLIRGMLGGCGATQHLLGNFRFQAVGEERVRSECYVRAAHAGKGEKAGLFYEVWAEYIDELECQANGRWLINRRQMRVYQETGDRGVLAPAS